MNRNEDHNNSQIPENSASKAMDSKKDVAKSPDEKTDQDFPGYPHYPASEDIMHKSTGSHRVDADLEQMGTGSNKSGVSQRFVEENNRTAHSGDGAEGENLNAGLDGDNDEMGLPQNVSNRDKEGSTPGTDLNEAAEKGSTNP